MQPQRCGGPAKRDGKQRMPVITAVISGLNLGSIEPRSAIREGIAKCAGVQDAAIRAPISVPTLAAAIPTGIATIVVCIGEKPSESNVAYWRRLSA